MMAAGPSYSSGALLLAVLACSCGRTFCERLQTDQLADAEELTELDESLADAFLQMAGAWVPSHVFPAMYEQVTRHGGTPLRTRVDALQLVTTMAARSSELMAQQVR